MREEIVELQKIQQILLFKNPKHPFLYPLVENAIYALTNLLAYVDAKNHYFRLYNRFYFYNRQATMHKSFFSDLHINAEDGLKEIIKSNNFVVKISNKKHVESIVEKIEHKISNSSKIKVELKEIIGLSTNIPSFNDHLHTVLKNIPGLSKEYIAGCRAYFDGISIIRNKVSHPKTPFTQLEKAKLTKAKLGRVISTKGTFQMTFEGYKLLIQDILRFFDNLHAHL